jgi:hypothetical protein
MQRVWLHDCRKIKRRMVRSFDCGREPLNSSDGYGSVCTALPGRIDEKERAPLFAKRNRIIHQGRVSFGRVIRREGRDAEEIELGPEQRVQARFARFQTGPRNVAAR